MPYKIMLEKKIAILEADNKTLKSQFAELLKLSKTLIGQRDEWRGMFEGMTATHKRDCKYPCPAYPFECQGDKTCSIALADHFRAKYKEGKDAKI